MATRTSITGLTTRTSLRPPSRLQLALFLAGTAALSFVLQTYLIREAKTVHSFVMLGLMWVPGLVALACSHYFENRFRDLALVKPGKMSMIYAYVIPAGCALLTLLVLVAAGIGKIKWPEISIFRMLLFYPFLGVLISFSLAIGSELGWRGFLHSHMMRARVPEPLLVIGLLWSAWHWPLIVMADYKTSSMPWLSVALFTVTTTSFSIILGWLREYSKSIFPCALAHAVHITWTQDIYPGFYRPGKLDPFFGGQSGFVLAIIYLVIALYLYRNKIAASNY